MTQQLSESSGALTRMLDDERRRFEAERASDAQIAVGIKDKLYSLLDVSYKLGCVLCLVVDVVLFSCCCYCCCRCRCC